VTGSCCRIGLKTNTRRGNATLTGESTLVGGEGGVFLKSRANFWSVSAKLQQLQLELILFLKNLKYVFNPR
jgi:hypothetical protein